jgi:predicted ArsR family transcriptional regulator
MLNNLMLDVKIKNICKDKTLKSKAKIKQVLFIKPNVTPIELSKLLEVTTMAIRKQLKAINKLC